MQMQFEDEPSKWHQFIVAMIVMAVIIAVNWCLYRKDLRTDGSLEPTNQSIRMVIRDSSDTHLLDTLLP